MMMPVAVWVDGVGPEIVRLAVSTVAVVGVIAAVLVVLWAAMGAQR